MTNLTKLTVEELIELQGEYLNEEDYQSAQQIEDYLETINL